MITIEYLLNIYFTKNNNDDKFWGFLINKIYN